MADNGSLSVKDLSQKHSCGIEKRFRLSLKTTRDFYLITMAATKIIVLLVLLVLTTLLEHGECRKRQSLCRLNRKTGSCYDVTRRTRGGKLLFGGRCKQIGGSCEFLAKRKISKCACVNGIYVA
ncbi:uncharacterized protein LOC123540878 [Mercenaria mercenaria]|uniref:uncharacterized protein LOC123540878 n=1 Tax=Mercenaria mercenaria TaxID=6596 RepID=UPI00234E8143|nr:uncharacterized protein LOC123540878 [Mercenaria mercenaria]